MPFLEFCNYTKLTEVADGYGPAILDSELGDLRPLRIT
jgi:hypothetical protein